MTMARGRISEYSMRGIPCLNQGGQIGFITVGGHEKSLSNTTSYVMAPHRHPPVIEVGSVGEVIAYLLPFSLPVGAVHSKAKLVD